jgi:hypothetical protein
MRQGLLRMPAEAAESEIDPEKRCPGLQAVRTTNIVHSSGSQGLTMVRLQHCQNQHTLRLQSDRLKPGGSLL